MSPESGARHHLTFLSPSLDLSFSSVKGDIAPLVSIQHFTRQFTVLKTCFCFRPEGLNP